MQSEQPSWLLEPESLDCSYPTLRGTNMEANWIAYSENGIHWRGRALWGCSEPWTVHCILWSLHWMQLLLLPRFPASLVSVAICSQPSHLCEHRKVAASPDTVTAPRAIWLCDHLQCLLWCIGSTAGSIRGTCSLHGSPIQLSTFLRLPGSVYSSLSLGLHLVECSVNLSLHFGFLPLGICVVISHCV